jgi:hypothetical protein
MQRAGKQSSSHSIAPWSICKVHERLRARYWPSLTGEAGTAEPLPMN